MKCQILFSGKNKKNIINLSSAENAQRVVKINITKSFYAFGRGACHNCDLSFISPFLYHFQIEKELSVNRSELSSTIRAKTSADDSRPSAVVVGYTLGVALLSLSLGMIFISDIPKILGSIHILFNNIQSRFGRPNLVPTDVRRKENSWSAIGNVIRFETHLYSKCEQLRAMSAYRTIKSRNTAFPTKLYVRLAKTQISCASAQSG